MGIFRAYFFDCNCHLRSQRFLNADGVEIVLNKLSWEHKKEIGHILRMDKIGPLLLGMLRMNFTIDATLQIVFSVCLSP